MGQEGGVSGRGWVGGAGRWDTRKGQEGGAGGWGRWEGQERLDRWEGLGGGGGGRAVGGRGCCVKDVRNDVRVEELGSEGWLKGKK